jgi:DNA repair protein RadC
MRYKIRYETYTIKEKPEVYLRCPEHVLELVKKDYSPLQEVMVVLGLNVKNGVIYKKTIAMGSYNTIMCTPADIFRPLLIAGCGAFIIAHNHISGDTTPSHEDIVFTKKVEKASMHIGLSFLDHVIYTPDDNYSFKNNGVI